MNNRALIQGIYETPEYFAEHLRHTSGAIIMEACSGSFTPTLHVDIA